MGHRMTIRSEGCSGRVAGGVAGRKKKRRGAFLWKRRRVRQLRVKPNPSNCGVWSYILDQIVCFWLLYKFCMQKLPL